MLRRSIRSFLFLVVASLTIIRPALGQFSAAKIMAALQNHPDGLVLVASHRGEIDGPYMDNAPENSIAAAYNAMQSGLEMIEIDVYTTEDGVPYLMHDKALSRTVGRNAGTNYGQPTAPYWSNQSGIDDQRNNLQNATLCAGRGATITNGETCDPTQEKVPSLLSFVSTVAPATVPCGAIVAGGAESMAAESECATYPWDGVIILDIRDLETLKQCWQVLVQNANADIRTIVANQVIFKINPGALLKNWHGSHPNDAFGDGPNTPDGLTNFLAELYGSSANPQQAALSDMKSYMNLMTVYQTEPAKDAETLTGHANWAILNWTRWAAAADEYNHLLSPMVGVKNIGGKLYGSDALYKSVYSALIPTATDDSLDTIGIYAWYPECYNESGKQLPQSTGWPNLPASDGAGHTYNGYYSTKGKCVVMQPEAYESSDYYDHRYDYSFVASTLHYRMIIADTAPNLVEYLQSKDLRNLGPILASQ